MSRHSLETQGLGSAPDDGMSLAILCKDTKALKPVIQYLAKRGFTCLATSSVSDLLNHLSRFQVDYVLVSVNHRQRHVAKLIKAMRAGQLETIAFGETNSARTVALIENTHVDHQLFPPVSSVAIERMIISNNKKRGVLRQARNGNIITTGGKNTIPQHVLLKGTVAEKNLRAFRRIIAKDPKFSNDTDEQVDLRASTFEQVKQVMVVPLHALDHPGFLVTTTQHSDSFSTDEWGGIVSHLGDRIPVQGIDRVIPHAFRLDIQATSFLEWVDSSSLKCGIVEWHNQLVAYGIFKNLYNQYPIKQSPRPEMLTVDRHSIQTKTPLKNDLYIYLPRNDKYVPYFNRGQKFAGDKVKKLVSYDVRNLHIRKTDRDKFLHHQIEGQVLSLLGELT